MKKILVVLVVIIGLFSCENSNKKVKKHIGKADGRWNSLLVVMPSNDWKGGLGDSIRAIFAKPISDLPSPEPQFTLTQIDYPNFSNYLLKQRNILILNINDTTHKELFLYKKNVFAKPQEVFQLNGTKAKIMTALNTHASEMLDTFYDKGIIAFNAEQNSTVNKKNLAALSKIGLKIKVPKLFKLAENKGDFFWFMKDIKNGYSNLIVYDFPITETPFDSLPNYILQKRDEIGKKYIPGELEDSHIISEIQFYPSVIQTTFKESRAFISKGLWKMHGEFKGGPYINYVIEDKPNSRYLVLEGFIYAPNTKKRNYLFELDAAIQTAELIKK